MVKNKSNLQDLELAILRNAVDKIQHEQKREEMKSGEIEPIVKIVENFIKKKKLGLLDIYLHGLSVRIRS